MTEDEKNFIKNNIINNDGEITPQQLNGLFAIYNQTINPKNPEFGKSCSACKKKVIEETIQKYNESK